jgi:putative protein-disulfide isomerase
MDHDLEFVYVGDPMCSWCWGFAPVLDRMTEVYDVPIRFVAGGLRPGPDAEVLDDSMAGMLAHHWHQVEASSGQPFDHTFLKRRDGWRYDTEVPAIATVTMRSLDDKQVLPFHSRLQHAFYAEGVDVTDRTVYPALVEGFPIDQAEFLRRFASDEMKARTRQDFAEARSMGVAGFPTLLVRDGQEYGVVTRGFLPADTLLPALSDWLIGRYTKESDGLFCEPGVTC